MSEKLVVYKHQLSLTEPMTFTWSLNSQVIHIGEQDDKYYMWVLHPIRSDLRTEIRHFFVEGTGQPIELFQDNHINHIATFLSGIFVWHVFELV